MSFLIVDKKSSDAEALTSILSQISPQFGVTNVQSAEEALDLEDMNFGVAFIDPDAGTKKMGGVELAEKLKSLNRNIHVIFVTSSQKYLLEAFRVHADAYLLKPVSEEDIRREINYLENSYPEPLKANRKVIVQTFGLFSIFVDGKLVEFERNKAKELLALLIDRRDMPVRTREAVAALFQNQPFDKNTIGYYHVVVNSLVKTLDKMGIRDILIRRKTYLAINPSRFDCDAYRFLRGDVKVMKQFRGDYLSGYTWPGIPANILINRGAKK